MQISLSANRAHVFLLWLSLHHTSECSAIASLQFLQFIVRAPTSSKYAIVGGNMTGIRPILLPRCSQSRPMEKCKKLKGVYRSYYRYVDPAQCRYRRRTEHYLHRLVTFAPYPTFHIILVVYSLNMSLNSYFQLRAKFWYKHWIQYVRFTVKKKYFNNWRIFAVVFFRWFARECAVFLFEVYLLKWH